MHIPDGMNNGNFTVSIEWLPNNWLESFSSSLETGQVKYFNLVLKHRYTTTSQSREIRCKHRKYKWRENQTLLNSISDDTLFKSVVDGFLSDKNTLKLSCPLNSLWSWLNILIKSGWSSLLPLILQRASLCMESNASLRLTLTWYNAMWLSKHFSDSLWAEKVIFVLPLPSLNPRCISRMTRGPIHL